MTLEIQKRLSGEEGDNSPASLQQTGQKRTMLSLPQKLRQNTKKCCLILKTVKHWNAEPAHTGESSPSPDFRKRFGKDL